jgi:hypothetical protein
VNGYVVEGSGHEGSGPGRWWHFEAATSISFVACLWGGVVALLGFGWRFCGCMGSKVVAPACSYLAM